MSEPAPFTPATLARIRAGASAADLRWTQERYNRVCDDHGLAKHGIVVKSAKPVQIRTCGLVEYDPSTGIVRRGEQTLLLVGRQKAIFEHLFSLAAAAADHAVSTETLIGATGDCSTSHMSDVVKRLAAKLPKVKCRIDVLRAKGCRLVVEP